MICAWKAMYTYKVISLLSSISVSLESKPELQYVVGKLTSKAVSPRALPLSIDYAKGNVLGGGRERERERERLTQ